MCTSRRRPIWNGACEVAGRQKAVPKGRLVVGRTTGLPNVLSYLMNNISR